jgi:peptidyl-prolyl cis-trans isomerase B (cyclophilin B)
MEQELQAHQTRRRRRLMINLLVLLSVAGVLAFIVAQTRDQGEPSAAEDEEVTPVADFSCDKPEEPNRGPFEEAPPQTVDPSKTYIATIETSLGVIEVELASEEAPETVNSFAFLACQGFYDGLTFNRIVPGFAIQGGDPRGEGGGGPGYQVVEAPPSDLTYSKGVVAMAKSGADPPGTSTSAFFIVPGEGAADLEPIYALLGVVVSGEEVLAAFEELELEEAGDGVVSRPVEPVFMESVVVEES